MPKRRITDEQKDVATRVITAIESARAAKENFNNAAVSFLLTELDSAITFCKIRITIASFSDHPKVEKELGHVEHALVNSLRLKRKVRMKAHEGKQFREKMQQLEALVTRLSERGHDGSRFETIERCLTHLRG